MATTQKYKGHEIIVIKERGVPEWKTTIIRESDRQIVKTITSRTNVKRARSLAKDWIDKPAVPVSVPVDYFVHDQHKGRIVLHGFAKTNCGKCGKEIITSHTPGDKVCEHCSKEFRLCTVCGGDIDKPAV